MIRKLKIFEDENLIYEGNLSVNTAIFKGRLTKNPTLVGKAVHFTLQVSGGKNSQTNEWNKSTFVDCCAFDELGEMILEKYHEKDEIFVIAKFYSNIKDDKVYKGFNIKKVINVKADDLNLINDDDLPF